MPAAARPNPIERRMNRFLREPPSVRNAAAVIVLATLTVVVAGGVAIRVLDHISFRRGRGNEAQTTGNAGEVEGRSQLPLTPSRRSCLEARPAAPAT